MAYPSTIDTFSPRTDNVDDVMAADINAVYTSTTATQTELGTDPAGSAADVKTRLAHSLSDGGYLSFDDSTALTIASGAITVTQNFHRIDGEGSASDNLDTISGGEAGWWLVLRNVNDARDITFRHGVGNIYCAGGVNFTLDETNEMALLIYDGNQSVWLAMKGSSGESLTGAGTANYIPFYSAANTVTSSADFAFTTAAGLVGNESAGTAVDLRWEGDTKDKLLFVDASADEVQLGDPTGGNYVKVGSTGATTLYGTSTIRTATAVRYRYYHIPLYSSDPGVSGPKFTAPTANTLGGWQLNAAGELLYLESDVHADWDAASDLKLEIKFECNVNNTGGGAGDTVDLKLVCYYKGNAETACKTQTVENAVTVGQSAQYKRFTTTFTIDYDAASNVVEVGDSISMILNLETDTSEVDDIIICDASFYYSTTHIGIEAV
jgi:hypothetical protein